MSSRDPNVTLPSGEAPEPASKPAPDAPTLYAARLSGFDADAMVGADPAFFTGLSPAEQA